jgi:hypothetical protein
VFGGVSISCFTFNDLYKLLIDCRYYNIRAEGIIHKIRKEDDEFIEKLLSVLKPDMRIQYLYSRYIILKDKLRNIMKDMYLEEKDEW